MRSRILSEMSIFNKKFSTEGPEIFGIFLVIAFCLPLSQCNSIACHALFLSDMACVIPHEGRADELSLGGKC